MSNEVDAATDEDRPPLLGNRGKEIRLPSFPFRMCDPLSARLSEGKAVTGASDEPPFAQSFFRASGATRHCAALQMRPSWQPPLKILQDASHRGGGRHTPHL